MGAKEEENSGGAQGKTDCNNWNMAMGRLRQYDRMRVCVCKRERGGGAGGWRERRKENGRREVTKEHNQQTSARYAKFGT